MHIPTLRAEPGKFLTREQVLKVAPSIGATKAHPKTSERYTFVSTYDVIRELTHNHGFGVVEAGQRATRRRKPEFTRHFVRLRSKNAKPILNEAIPEVLITNSHDGQSRYTVHGGLFRMVCSNGLVLPVANASSSTSKLHLGELEEITKLTLEVIEKASNLSKNVARMQKKMLTESGMNRFAREAAKIAYDEVDFDTKVLLKPRRTEDNGNSVWTVFNRVQENIVRGGVEIATATDEDRARTTRGITHIGRSIDLNTGLWTLAEKAAA